MTKRARNGRGGGLQGLPVFLLLAAFALLSLLLVAMGARVYRAVERRADGNERLRTALSYVAGKLRAGDEAGCVRLREIDGSQVLCLRSEAEGTAFVTYIYGRDGGVCEYVSLAERAFDPALGERVVEAEGFSMRVYGDAGDGIELSVSDADGEPCTLRVRLACSLAEVDG